MGPCRFKIYWVPGSEPPKGGEDFILVKEGPENFFFEKKGGGDIFSRKKETKTFLTIKISVFKKPVYEAKKLTLMGVFIGA